MTKRVLTVSSVSAAGRLEVPFIRLRGKWLQVLGFGIGQKITVEESEGQLILKVIKEG
ncbi:MAG: type I toxin-antitoxin system SymE family toxin [Firmicutes bacterium]|nr:type I toxin-antitoxin system SymE family toxin [Bacillota bacterium]